MYNITMAKANLRGGPLGPQIRGEVFFQDVPEGVMIYTQVYGLPQYQPGQNNDNPIGPHGFHIHENGSCLVGETDKPFQGAGGHWNPYNQPHGNHAGDFPVLFSNNGYAFMSFFTNKFKSRDIINKTVIIHQSPDDYRSQPSGDAGKRIACGLICPYTPYLN